MNNVNLVGRTVEDPADSLKYNTQGTAVCNFTIAVDRNYNDETDFFDVVVWRKQAENCANYLDKGRLIAVTGELKQERWENDQGQQRSKVVINGRNVQFLDYGDSEDNGQDEQDLEVPF